MSREKKFLFVCGCPRSGTTVLAQLLNWHPKISVGIERFAKALNRDGDLFMPRNFNKNRFFKIRKRDCFYDSFEFKAYSDWYCSEFSEEKYHRSLYVGDKIPKLYNYFDVVNNNFINENYEIIFILRDIVSVAQSYNVRAHNPNDKWKIENNFKKAIFDWNEAVSAIYQQLENPKYVNNLIILNYDDFFLDYTQGIEKLPMLFTKLGLKVGSELIKGYDLLKDNSQKILAAKQKKKEIYQTYELDRKYIQNNALLDKYDFIKQNCI